MSFPQPSKHKSASSFGEYGGEESQRIEHFWNGVDLNCVWCPILSAEKSGKDGARKSIAKAKML
jgi:hypothetical protein